jgi:hypothetical protein
MYDAYFEDRSLLPPNQFVELSYEELVGDPKSQLRSIYERLELGDFARVEPALDDHSGRREELPDEPPLDRRRVERADSP